MKVTIYWMCSHSDKVKIVEKYNLPEYVSLNGETEANVTQEVCDRLKVGEQLGYLKLRNK